MLPSDGQVEFRILPCHPGYAVGDDGSVWSRMTCGCKPQIGCEWRRLKISTSKKGYLFLNIGRGNPRTVHTLVLEAFVGPCPEGCECRHLDGVKTNCRLGNLKWGTPLENAADRISHGHQHRGELSPGSKLTEEMVVLARNLKSDGATYSQLSEMLQVSNGCIQSLVERKNWKHVV